MKRAVLLLAAINIVAMGAGLGREVALAHLFGTTKAADALIVILLSIEGVTALAASGLAGYMLVPAVTRLMRQAPLGREYALIETLCLWALTACAPLLLAAVLWPEPVAAALAPRFSTAQHRLLADLLRLCLPAVPLILVSGILGGLLQARQDYYTPVIGRALFSLCVAGLLVFGGRRLGVRAGAAGVLLGAVLQLAAQGLALLRMGWKPCRPRYWHPVLSETLRFGLPMLAALVLTNVLMGIVQRALASGLPEGSLAAVNYAQRALGLAANLSLALATVSLTELSVEFSVGGVGRTALETLERNLDSGMFLLIPLSLWMLLGSEPLAAILFQRGKFDSASLALTAACLRWFTASVVPGMALAILLRAYSAFWRPWGAVAISLVWLTVTLGMTALLLPALGVVALPAAYAAGTTLACLASVAGLWRLIGAAFVLSRTKYLLRICAYSAVAAAPAAVLPAQSLRAFATQSAVFGLGFLFLCLIGREPNLLSLRGIWRRPRPVSI